MEPRVSTLEIAIHGARRAGKASLLERLEALEAAMIGRACSSDSMPERVDKLEALAGVEKAKLQQ